jgi:xanthine dehydrogenase large subunit
MGGGFGGKESQGNALAVACAVAARATGRPCKMRYDRDDDILITGKRHDFRIDYRAGFDDDGRILGIEFRSTPLRLGAGPVAAGRRPRDAARRQRLFPARRADRKPPAAHQHASATAFRGFGGPQGMLGIERVMDHVAHAWAATRWRCGGRISTRRSVPARTAPDRRSTGAVQTTPYRPRWRYRCR